MEGKLTKQKRAADVRIASQSWKTLVGPVAKKYGPRSPEALKAKLAWEQLNARRMPVTLALKAIGQTEGSAADMRVVARLFGKAGRILTPVGVVTGAWQVWHPDHRGPRGVVDRVAGATSVALPFAEAAVALELIAVPGVGECVMVIGAGVALWSLGNLAYDQRRAIEHAFRTSGKFIVRTSEKTGKVLEANPGILLGPPGELAKLAWDHRSGIGAVAAKTVHAGEHIGEDMVHAAEWGYDETIAGLGAAKKAISSVEHWVTHW